MRSCNEWLARGVVQRVAIFRVCSRVRILRSYYNLELSKDHDKYFANDKSADGKYVCVFCWKLKHTASRCKTAKSKFSKGKDSSGKGKNRKGGRT